jgi:hypothetical protein
MHQELGTPRDVLVTFIPLLTDIGIGVDTDSKSKEHIME